MTTLTEEKYRTVIGDLCTVVAVLTIIVYTKPLTPSEEEKIKYAHKAVRSCLNIYINKL